MWCGPLARRRHSCRDELDLSALPSAQASPYLRTRDGTLTVSDIWPNGPCYESQGQVKPAYGRRTSPLVVGVSFVGSSERACEGLRSEVHKRAEKSPSVSSRAPSELGGATTSESRGDASPAFRLRERHYGGQVGRLRLPRAVVTARLRFAPPQPKQDGSGLGFGEGSDGSGLTENLRNKAGFARLVVQSHGEGTEATENGCVFISLLQRRCVEGGAKSPQEKKILLLQQCRALWARRQALLVHPRSGLLKEPSRVATPLPLVNRSRSTSRNRASDVLRPVV